MQMQDEGGGCKNFYWEGGGEEGGSKLDSEITLFFYTLQPKWAENYPSRQAIMNILYGVIHMILSLPELPSYTSSKKRTCLF